MEPNLGYNGKKGIAMVRENLAFLGRMGLSAIGLIFIYSINILAQEEPPTPPPTIRITDPTQGQFLNGVCTIRIEVSSMQEIAQVTVLRDGAFLETDPLPPFEIRWDTRREADGPHQLAAKAASPNGKEILTPPITVKVDNSPPYVLLTHPATNTIVVGNVPMEIEASDSVGLAEVRLRLDGEVLQVLSQAPYRWTWESKTASNGIHVLEAQAVDRAGHSRTSERIAVKTMNPNRAPILSPTDAQTVKEGSLLSFILTAADPDGARDQVSYRAVDLPSWANLDPRTGEVKGIPDFDVASISKPSIIQKVRFEACDPEPLCDSQEVLITVLNVNRPPTFKPIPDVALREGGKLTVQFEAADPDGDDLLYTAQRLPSWLEFDAQLQSLRGTLGPQAVNLNKPVKSETVGIQACDPEPLCGRVTFTITAQDKNRPPVFDPIKNQKLDEGDTLTLTLRATDPDNDPVSLAAAALPPGALFTDQKNGSGKLTWETQTDQAGTYEIEFLATDKESLSTQKAEVTVGETSLSVSGTIAVQYGDPLEGVAIEFLKGGTRKKTTTDSNGFYLMSDLSPGTYILKPSYEPTQNFSTIGKELAAAGFSPQSQSVVLTDKDQREVNFTAVLRR